MKKNNFVAVHKVAPLYGDGSYQFLHVGAERNPIVIEGAVDDNEFKDNISIKNDIYCELTGYYHIWKHIKDVDYVGFCHYRRFFAHKRFSYHPSKAILTNDDILSLLKKCDVVLAAPNSKRGRRHGCFPNEEEAKEFFPYRVMLPVIEELYPDYVDAFKEEFLIPEMSYFNMLICRKDLFDEYCHFLFDILFMVESNLKKDSCGGVAPREMGFFSEWLLNVWVRKNKLKVAYKPVLFIDYSHNWHYFIKYLMQQIGLSKLVYHIELFISNIKGI